MALDLSNIACSCILVAVTRKKHVSGILIIPAVVLLQYDVLCCLLPSITDRVNLNGPQRKGGREQFVIACLILIKGLYTVQIFSTAVICLVIIRLESVKATRTFFGVIVTPTAMTDSTVIRTQCTAQ